VSLSHTRRDTPLLAREFFINEASLSPGLSPLRDAAGPDILVTGAAGLVGAYLVRELLERTSATIFALVRSSGPVPAHQRLIEQLTLAGAPVDVVTKRVRVLDGDCSAPAFGLAPHTYAELSERVGIIFHNAARLHFLLSYRALCGTNVGGARRVLEFAASGGHKTIAHTSSYSIFEHPAMTPGTVTEDMRATSPEMLATGYMQTKWVAEQLFDAARAAGFDVITFRPPWIVAPDPLASPDFVVRFQRQCFRLRALPDMNYRWNVVRGDEVARAIAALTLSGERRMAVYHLGNADVPGVREVAAQLLRLDRPLPIVPSDVWRDRLAEALQSGGDEPLRPLAPLFFRVGRTRHEPAANGYLFNDFPVMDSRATIAELNRLGVAPPLGDDVVLSALLGDENVERV